MLSNVFLFSGEEKYLLNQELRRRTDSFVQKYGADALFVYKTDSFSLESLRQTLYSGGLFVQKKLIVVYGVPLDSDTSNKVSAAFAQQFTDEFVAKQGHISPDILLIFVSYKPDKRTKFFSFLKNELGPNGIKEFGPLKPFELKQIIRQKSPSLKRSESVLEYFLSKVGTSLFHIENELEKLVLWAEISKNDSVSEADIDLQIFSTTEVNNFNFFDLLFVDKQKALDLVVNLQEEGESWNSFAGTLYWGIKLWLFIIDCFEQDITDPKAIASLLKAHPFVITKMTKYSQVLSRNKKGILAFYMGLIELDNDIKTGKKSDFSFWLEVKKMIIRLF